MYLAIATWDLHLPACHSLKEKRSVLKPLTSAMRRTLNVSVAETGQQDLWQRAEIACAAVGSDRSVGRALPPIAVLRVLGRSRRRHRLQLLRPDRMAREEAVKL